ncbi:hypothetical protein PGIGA_G00240440 [Pangasianodon gigas]|uniref:Uncharacterized protein n=1 Tax=Pangasianodon gigas TaxID=30993 RepID=A0ACC5WP72_PANGG|nr:hypothetical protein [Pangasianodon gigas]
MSSAVDTEVFIPEQASVITVPVNSLPSSITRKISVSPGDSDRPATFISPVELREKGTTLKPRPLTPGQFFLPVVTSNRKAFGMLRKFLQSGEISLQVADENSRAGSAFSRRKNSIVLFDEQIFLIVRNAKASDWPVNQRSSTPSECEAPPLNSPVKMQDGGSDITEGRSNEGTRGAEDHGKYAEKRSGDERDVVMECDAQDDDITDRKRSNDGAGAAEDHGKCVKEREGDVMKDREENEQQTPMKDASVNTSNDRRIKLEGESGVYALGGEDQSSLANAKEYKDGGSQITSSLRENFNPEITSEQGCASETGLAAETHAGNEKRSENPKHGDDKTKISEGQSSLAKAKCCKRLIFSRVQSPSLMNVNERQDKSDVKRQISEFEIPSDKTKASVSAAEIADVNDDDRVSQNITNEDVANSKSYVNIQASEGQSSRRESADEVVDVNDDDHVPSVSSDDENAVVPNFSKVKNLLEIAERLKRRINDYINSHGSEDKFKKLKTDDIVVETDSDCDDLVIVESCAEVDGSSTDEPNQHGSCKREVTSSSAAAKGCESAVEIVDVDDDRVLRKRTNDANRDAAGSRKSRVCPSPSVKRCKGDVDDDVEDLNDDDEVIVNDQEIVNEHERRFGDVAKGCKRKIFDGIKDETNSDVAAAAQNSGANGSSAKRSKLDDANFSPVRKPLESAVDSNSQVKNSNHDVELIEVDDNDEIHRSANNRNENVATVESCANETTVRRNRGNAEDSSDKVNSCGRRGENVESQSSLEKIKSCKRNVSDSNSTDEPNLDVKSLAQAQIIETEDPSAKHFKSANVTNPGGKTREKCTKTQRAVDQDDLINTENSSKAHISKAKSLLNKSDVEIAAVCDSDQVLRKSTQEPNQDDTNSKNDVNKTKTLAAKGPISEVQSSSVKNKSCKTAAEIVDVRDDDQTNDTNQIVTSVESCVESNVSEVQDESVAETVEASDERERASSDVTKDGICVESYVSEVRSAAEDRVLAGKSYSEEPIRDVTTSEVSGCESDVEDALVEEDNDLASASFTDEPNPYGTTSESGAELQICDVWSLSAMSEHRESNPDGQAFDPDPDGELADEQSEATNQRAHGDEVGILPRPTSSRANHELDYMVLRWEENINRIRARLRGMEEKLKSHL